MLITQPILTLTLYEALHKTARPDPPTHALLGGFIKPEIQRALVPSDSARLTLPWRQNLRDIPQEGNRIEGRRSARF